jgi:tetratricopeptide (TPR) repeat protein
MQYCGGVKISNQRTALLGALASMLWLQGASAGPRVESRKPLSLAGPGLAEHITVELWVELLENADVLTQGFVIFTGATAAEWRALAGGLDSGKATLAEVAERLGEALTLEGVTIGKRADVISERGALKIHFEIPPAQPIYAGSVRQFRLVTGPAAVAGLLPGAVVPGDEDKAEPASDYLWQPPFHAELRTRLIVPDGFVIHDRIQNGEWRAGPMSVRQRITSEGNRRLLTITLDTGPANLKAADLATVRSAWHHYLAEPGPAPSYDNEVVTLRDAGRLGDALARARVLVARNPQSAQKHAFLSSVLLDARLVLPARREARRATELDPRYVFAQQVLGNTFEYGSNGEFFGGDFDRAALVRERRKEVAVGPGGPRPELNLALALARDSQGHFLSADDDLVEIVRLATSSREHGWKREARPLLLAALLAAHRYSELEMAAREEPAENSYRLAAIAMQRGPAEALRELPSLEAIPDAAEKLLQQTGRLLSGARLYEEAAPLLAETARRVPTLAAELSARAAYRRHEGLVLDPRKPDDVVRAVKLSCQDLSHFLKERGRLLGETLFEGEAEDRDRVAYHSTCALAAGIDSRSPAMIDGTLAGPLVVTGDRTTGFTVEERAAGTGEAVTRRYYFVVPDRGGRLQLVASDVAEVGREALRQVESRRLEIAAHLLDGGVAMLSTILRRIKETHVKDPSLELRLERLKLLWPGKGSRQDPDRLRTAAAVLAGVRSGKLTIPVLERAFARATGGERDAIGEELTVQYQTDKRWAEVSRLAQTLSATSRATPLVHECELIALGKLGRTQELEALVADWQRRWPNDVLLERLLAQQDVDAGRLDEAIARLERLVQRPDAEANDHNNLAWYLFARGGNSARAIAPARRAVQLARSPGRVNTLACVLADAGQIDEAIKLMGEQQTATPGSPALSFLLGLIAERMGEPEEASRQYQRAISASKAGPLRPSDVASLAKARQARLPAGPP